MREKLRQEIERELQRLEMMEPGTEEYKVTVDGLTKLTDRAIEMDKLESETAEKAIARESDNELKQEQAKVDAKDRWIRNIIAAAGIIIPSVITIWGTKTSLKFEETGTITTAAGRNFIANLFRKK